MGNYICRYKKEDMPNKSDEYDKDYLQSLFNRGQYRNAVNYMKCFVPNDYKDRQRYNNIIMEQELNADEQEAIFSKLTKESQDKYIAYNNIYDRQSLINNKTRIVENKKRENKYITDILNLFDNVGNNQDNNMSVVPGLTMLVDRTIDAINNNKPSSVDSYSLTYKKGKQKLFGVDWLDWAKPDNENTIERFYESIGLSEVELRKAGVDIQVDDSGNTTVSFKKDHPYANLILAKAPIVESKYLNLGLFSYEYQTTCTSYNNKGEVENNDFAYNLMALQTAIRNWESEKENILSSVIAPTEQYDSYIGPSIGLKMNSIEQAYMMNNMTTSDYVKYKKDWFDDINTIVQAMSLQKQVVYADWSSKEDEILPNLVEVSQDDRKKLTELIRSSSDRITLNAYSANGEVGTLITISPMEITSEQKKNLNEGSDVENYYNGRSFQIYVPGLFANAANEAFGRDSNFQANKRLNSMKKYGYDYNTETNGKISYLGNDTYTIDGEYADKSEVLRTLNKDILIRQASNNLIYNYINNKGEIVDADEYKQMVNDTSFAILCDLYPEFVNDKWFKDLKSNSERANLLVNMLNNGIDLDTDVTMLKSQILNDFIDIYNTIAQKQP